MRYAGARTDRYRFLALAGLCVSAVLLIPVERYLAGGVVWALGLLPVVLDREPAFRRRMGMLYALVVLLAVAPIHTDTGTAHFLTLGLFFLAAVALPPLILGRTDPGVIRYTFLPRRPDGLDLFYVAISIPLAYGVISLYFFTINPEVPTHWPLPPEPDPEASWRLIAGINCVGIWDELFFVNTVYAILRSVFPHRLANAGQAALYASVLTDMAFTGIGPIVVYLFALTQGAMYERSNVLIYVLVVHVIVDVFLLGGIFGFNYPGTTHLGF